jgi:uncharacterized protein involved in response to NO
MNQTEQEPRRHRAAGGPALLRQGFRPFFLFAGIWAPLGLLLTFARLQGWIAVPSAFDPVAWHFHELLYGYVAAAITGFLLTAIPNWTGRLPLHGAPLLALASLWLAGRLAMASSGLIGGGLAAAIDVAFLVALVALVLREIVSGGNWRNLPVAVIVGLFALSNVVVHAEALGWLPDGGFGKRLGIAVVIALISLIGGRITPSFTRNWLVKQKADALPAQFGMPDKLALALTLAALLAWIAAPDTTVGAILLAAAAMAGVLRLARWQGPATRSEPLLLVLHVGYLWIPVGLALLALSHWLPTLTETGALHALTIGAMGTMTLAVMSRATLGHTGRELVAGPGLTAAFALISLAALSRVVAVVWVGAAQPLLILTAASWIGAYLCFLAVCGPMVLAKK